MVRFSNGWTIAILMLTMVKRISPFSSSKLLGLNSLDYSRNPGTTVKFIATIWKPDHSKSGHFLPDFKCFLDKVAAVCQDFKWLVFWISDPIQNMDHLKTNLFLNIWNPDESGFYIPTILDKIVWHLGHLYATSWSYLNISPFKYRTDVHDMNTQLYWYLDTHWTITILILDKSDFQKSKCARMPNGPFSKMYI